MPPLHPWQQRAFADQHPIVLLTGSAGGGKSYTAAHMMHHYLVSHPGAVGLLARKVRVSLTNSTVAQWRLSFCGAGSGVQHYPSKSRFEYANGSWLVYLGLEDYAQRERLKSIGPRGGVDIAWLEEATELELDDYEAIQARLRGTAGPYRQTILTTNPGPPTHWIKVRLIDGGVASVHYSAAADNPANPADYQARLDSLTGVEGQRLARGEWVQAEGRVYDTWSDGPETGSVTEAAEYVPDGGSVLWAVDDGYSGELDPVTRRYTATSHPRVFLLVQQRADGRLCVFAEHYAVRTLADAHIDDVLAMGYPLPMLAVVDKSAAHLRGQLHARNIATRRGPGDVAESIKGLRRMLAADENGWRRVLVHPRCTHLRGEMLAYRYDDRTGKPAKEHDHGPDALRYLAWVLRNTI